MLELKNLCVTYPDGTVAVDGVSLTLANGERAALIGANGAGKTSLLLSLVGVLPAGGRVSVGGVTLGRDTVDEIRTRVGLVFQNPDDQLFMPSIRDDISFGPANLGLERGEIDRRVQACLELLHVEHLRDKTALKLSGGEKRMAALATVLVMEPSVMLFDEPTAFLDPRARRTLIGILSALPHTQLVATHDLTFAAQTCPRSILLKNGKVFADGPSEELLYDAVLMEACGVEAIGVYEGGRIF